MPTKPKPVAEDTPRPPIGPLFTCYRLILRFMTKLCGSVPADPAIVAKWLAARRPTVRPAGSLSITEINEEVLASIERGEGEASQEFSLLTFQRHEGAIVMRAATVRSHIKDCARVLSAQFIGKREGERAFSTRVINAVYHDERAYWLPVTRDGATITTADGTDDRMVHTRDRMGNPINALKRVEYLEPPCELVVTLKVLGRSVSEVDLHHIFTYGGTHGYGGERGAGEGRYTYELERIDDDATSGGGVPATGGGAATTHGGGAHRKA